jgi:hypothetical protein
MTQGLDSSIICKTEFGLGSLTCRLGVSACGQVQPGAAQSPASGASTGPATTSNPLSSWLPILLFAGAALIIYKVVIK